MTVCLPSGAIVDKDDPLAVFDGQSEVLCNVDSWHIVGIEETYNMCCNTEGVTPIEDVLSKLKLSDLDKTLDFGDVVFETPMSRRAMLKTLNGHAKLQRLNLEQTLLSDSEWSLVTNSLDSLKCLKDLNLSASGLNKDNLEQMAKRLSELSGESNITKSLRKLNLSYNRLCDEAVGSLSALLSVLSNLFTLNLECVDLSNPSPQLASSLRSSTVRELNLSDNQLADGILSSLLGALENFTDLNLSGILDHHSVSGVDSGFSEGLLKLTTNANSRLLSLDISENDIPKHFIFDVVAALSEAKHLQALSLCGIDCVTDDVLVHFLRKRPKNLKKLNIENVSLSKPMKLEGIDSITDLFQGVSFDSFCFSDVKKIDAVTLIAQWKSIKGEETALVKGPVGSRSKYQFCLTAT